MYMLITLIVSIFMCGSRSFCGSLPQHDDLLTTAIGAAQTKAMNALANAESEYDTTHSFDVSQFLDEDDFIAPKVMRPADHLIRDLESLENAKGIIIWAQGKAKKCRQGLKTKAAKEALGEIMTACSIEISDMENALNRFSKKMPKKYPEGAVSYTLRELMESATNKCATILTAYLMSGALFGKVYEQDDAKALCDYVRNILRVYDDFHEDSQYYGRLRSIAAQYYDTKVNKNDIRACFDVLRASAKLATQSRESADDLDLIVLAEAAGEILDDFTAGLRIVHVDRNKFNAAHPQLRFYLQNAPAIFSLCKCNSVAVIEGEFKKNSWTSWPQVNQTIWVDPQGVMSARIKANGQITVGFLGSSPYRKNKTLDLALLGDRNNEELKLSSNYGEDLLVAVPATLDPSYKPFSFWSANVTPQQRVTTMKDTHINK